MYILSELKIGVNCYYDFNCAYVKYDIECCVQYGLVLNFDER